MLTLMLKFLRTMFDGAAEYTSAEATSGGWLSDALNADGNGIPPK